MGFYRKKPVVIQARQWTGDNFLEMVKFMGCETESYYNANSNCRFYVDHDTKDLVIKTLEGNHIAIPGDYIIRGVKGEFYPCKEDIFLQTYETA